MMWGCMITGLEVLLCSTTFLHLSEYVVLTVIGFTLFGIGLGFYATPSLDAALSTVSDSGAGAAAGMYKMASSLGNAMGVAISAAIYAAGQLVEPALIQEWGLFVGRQDNLVLRFGGAMGLLFNVTMVCVALASIIVTVPATPAPLRTVQRARPPRAWTWPRRRWATEAPHRPHPPHLKEHHDRRENQRHLRPGGPGH